MFWPLIPRSRDCRFSRQVVIPAEPFHLVAFWPPRPAVDQNPSDFEQILFDDVL